MIAQMNISLNLRWFNQSLIQLIWPQNYKLIKIRFFKIRKLFSPVSVF